MAAVAESKQATVRLEGACDELAEAIDSGRIGEIVAKHEKLILRYYEDVRMQASRSFNAALAVAVVGFVVLVTSLWYLFKTGGATESGITIGTIGSLSGVLTEGIASINFWLYTRTARQFGAFHVCLERTHRYLLAYKISGEIGENRGETLRELVCIMARAPMITYKETGDTDQRSRKASTGAGRRASGGGGSQSRS